MLIYLLCMRSLATTWALRSAAFISFAAWMLLLSRLSVRQINKHMSINTQYINPDKLGSLRYDCSCNKPFWCFSTSQIRVNILKPLKFRHQLAPEHLLQCFSLHAALHQSIVGLRDPLDFLLQLQEREIFIYKMLNMYLPSSIPYIVHAVYSVKCSEGWSGTE